MPKRKPGRPTKLNKERMRKLVAAIEAGNKYDTACALADISYYAFRQWIIRGEQEKDDTNKFRKFYEAIKKAEAVAEQKMVEMWIKAIPHDWKAARDFLRYRSPDRWNKQETIEHRGMVENVQKIDFSRLSNEELEELAKIAERVASPETSEPRPN